MKHQVPPDQRVTRRSIHIRGFCYALQCGTTQGNTNLLPLKEREKTGPTHPRLGILNGSIICTTGLRKRLSDRLSWKASALPSSGSTFSSVRE